MGCFDKTNKSWYLPSPLGGRLTWIGFSQELEPDDVWKSSERERFVSIAASYCVEEEQLLPSSACCDGSMFHLHVHHHLPSDWPIIFLIPPVDLIMIHPRIGGDAVTI